MMPVLHFFLITKKKFKNMEDMARFEPAIYRMQSEHYTTQYQNT